MFLRLLTTSLEYLFKIRTQMIYSSKDIFQVFFLFLDFSADHPVDSTTQIDTDPIKVFILKLLSDKKSVSLEPFTDFSARILMNLSLSIKL